MFHWIFRANFSNWFFLSIYEIITRWIVQFYKTIHERDVLRFRVSCEFFRKISIVFWRVVHIYEKLKCKTFSFLHNNHICAFWYRERIAQLTQVKSISKIYILHDDHLIDSFSLHIVHNKIWNYHFEEHAQRSRLVRNRIVTQR